jgi:hypothetical protein
MRQIDLFKDNDAEAVSRPKPYVFTPGLEKIRAELHEVIGKARASSSAPWDAKQFGCWRTVLPQMSRWLPDEERERICREFQAEVARLSAA